MNNANYVLAVTGASGSVYAVRLAQVMLRAGCCVHLVVSDAARQVSERELGLRLPDDTADADQWQSFLACAFDSLPASQWGFGPFATDTRSDILCHSLRDYNAGIASGSFQTAGMVVCPCSMGTLSNIASGASSNLIHRAADVHLKERRPLLLVPRETPLSMIAMENMVKLSRAGATVLPSMPGFYQNPACVADLVDFVVARICDHLKIPHSLIPRWGNTED